MLGMGLNRWSRARSVITAVETYVPTNPQPHCGFSALIYVGPVLHWYYRAALRHPSFSLGAIVRRKSYDNSRTWTAEEVVYQHASLDVCEVTAIIAPNGDLLLMGYLSTWSESSGTPTVALLLRSDDGGATFSEETFTPTDFRGPTSVAWEVFYGQPFIDGTTITADAYFELSGAFWCSRLVSTNSGVSWSVAGSSQSGFNEVQTIPPDLTNLTRFLRSNSSLNDCYSSRSTNGGTNWTTPGLFAFGVGQRACKLANGDWVLSLGRRVAPGGSNLYLIPAAGGGRYLSRRFRAAAFTGDITDCGYMSMVQAQGEPFLIAAGYQYQEVAPTYPSAIFLKRIPLTSLARGPWTETFADLSGVDYYGSIASVSGNRLRIFDNSGSSLTGAGVVLNGGSTGDVFFDYEAAANPNYPTIQLRNVSGQPVFWFYHNPDGEWFQGYDGTNIVNPTTPVSIPLNTLTNIRLNWNSETGLCEVLIDGVSKGTTPKDATYSGEIASIWFLSGSTPGTGDDYRISNLGQAA